MTTYEGVVADVLAAFHLKRSDDELSQCKRRLSERFTHDQRVGFGRRSTGSIQHVKLGANFHTLCTTQQTSSTRNVT